MRFSLPIPILDAFPLSQFHACRILPFTRMKFPIMKSFSSISQNIVLEHESIDSTFSILATSEADRQNHSLTPKCAQVAIGGWGDTTGFDVAAATDITRRNFAQNVKKMVDATGADG